jgi:Xaa-Pro aminopeptidase
LPWAAPAAREDAVRALLGRGGCVASDRPSGDELALPARLAGARLRLMQAEIERFRALGTDASRALTATLRSVRPDMTEVQVAAITAEELVQRAMWPLVILVAGARRMPIYRHPLPRAHEPIDDRAMVVVCARRHGLVANLTRLVYFRPQTDAELSADAAVADVEAAAFAASRAGATLGDVYGEIAAAYVRAGVAGAEAEHHQGGLAGYRTREEIATPGSVTPISEGSALAWNPSLPGTKLEDTVVVTPDGLEILTVDPEWPTVTVDGRARPDVLALG